MFWKKKSLVNEYIKLMHRTMTLDNIFTYAVYKWIQYNVDIANPDAPSITQIGKAQIQYKPNEVQRGFTWRFDNYSEPKLIIISYTIIKNKWGDVDDDKEVTLTFAEFEKWI